MASSPRIALSSEYKEVGKCLQAVNKYCLSDMRKAIERLSHLHPQSLRSRTFVSTKMAKLSIDSKYKMLSGYDIPALGYGVSEYI